MKGNRGFLVWLLGSFFAVFVIAYSVPEKSKSNTQYTVFQRMVPSERPTEKPLQKDFKKSEVELPKVNEKPLPKTDLPKEKPLPKTDLPRFTEQDRLFLTVKYHSGNTKEEGEVGLSNGAREGLWTVYTENGRKVCEKTYVHDLLHGPFKLWPEYGIAEEGFWDGQYHKGKKTGVWKWKEKGERYIERQFSPDGDYYKDTVYKRRIAEDGTNRYHFVRQDDSWQACPK